jgi:hypothetical protein
VYHQEEKAAFANVIVPVLGSVLGLGLELGGGAVLSV